MARPSLRVHGQSQVRGRCLPHHSDLALSHAFALRSSGLGPITAAGPVQGDPYPAHCTAQPGWAASRRRGEAAALSATPDFHVCLLIAISAGGKGPLCWLPGVEAPCWGGRAQRRRGAWQTHGVCTAQGGAGRETGRRLRTLRGGPTAGSPPAPRSAVPRLRFPSQVLNCCLLAAVRSE